jgi:hypothetical protein
VPIVRERLFLAGSWALAVQCGMPSERDKASGNPYEAPITPTPPPDRRRDLAHSDAKPGLMILSFVSLLSAGYCFLSFSVYFVLPLVSSLIIGLVSWLLPTTKPIRLAAVFVCSALWMLLTAAPVAMSFLNREFSVYARLFLK